MACFDGGNFILGGLLLDSQSYIDFGLTLTASCRATYTATKTGIGPETFRWQDSQDSLTAGNNQGPPTSDRDFYKRAGYWIDSGAYVLRPEVMESYYYAYRATGDEKYRDWAWEAFLRINYTCAVGSGYSAIVDVDAPQGGGYYDFQESFWFAEVLKYSYLLFAEVWLSYPSRSLLPISTPPPLLLIPAPCCRSPTSKSRPTARTSTSSTPRRTRSRLRRPRRTARSWPVVCVRGRTRRPGARV